MESSSTESSGMTKEEEAFRCAKLHIEEIRTQKFSIGKKDSNPLTLDLHHAVTSLSAELYQKDIHFLMELIQNAEDNEYKEGVEPTLEFVLTKKDITGSGAPATLLVFNNEVGFSRKNMDSICSIGRSTKKGKRQQGFIGEKGIGFKSVFLVSSQPHIFSNGYRVRFKEEPDQDCGIGYVVPQWVSWKPYLSSIHDIYGCTKILPTTTLILPLKPDKVEAVRAQLSGLHPELLLFLSKVKRLFVRGCDPEEADNVSTISIFNETENVELSNKRVHSRFVQLSVKEKMCDVEQLCKYYLWTEEFPVISRNRVPIRMDVEKWVITLAFPFGERLRRGTSSVGVFAFLPTAMVTNFPFLIQADFILASSRESILLDNVWNLGILDKALSLNLASSESQGGPLLLMELAFLLRSVGTEVCWVTIQKPVHIDEVTYSLENKMLDRGVQVLSEKGQEATNIALKADLIVLNTAVAGKWMELDATLKENVPHLLPKVLWWIHEMRGHYFKLDYVKHLPAAAGSMIDSHVTAEYWKNRTRERLGIKMPETFVVHLGNSKELMEVAEDTVAKRVLREHVRESLGVRSEDLLFAIINSVSRGKGQDLFLRSFYESLRLVQEKKLQLPKMHAVVVGSDMTAHTKFESELRNFVKMKKIQDRVHFVNKTLTVAPYLAAIDVLVQNSQARGECFGRITIEAMSFQLPVLGTAAGGTTEIVVNGTTGFLHPVGKEGVTPLAKNIVNLATHVERRLTMGKRGYERVKERFLEHHMANRIAAVLKAVLQKSKSHSDA